MIELNQIQWLWLCVLTMSDSAEVQAEFKERRLQSVPPDARNQRHSVCQTADGDAQWGKSVRSKQTHYLHQFGMCSFHPTVHNFDFNWKIYLLMNEYNIHISIFGWKIHQDVYFTQHKHVSQSVHCVLCSIWAVQKRCSRLLSVFCFITRSSTKKMVRKRWASTCTLCSPTPSTPSMLKSWQTCRVRWVQAAVCGLNIQCTVDSHFTKIFTK